MNRVTKIICGIFILLSIMFAEYRFIMVNLIPCTTDVENIISIEIFGIVDEYYIDKNENNYIIN